MGTPSVLARLSGLATPGSDVAEERDRDLLERCAQAIAPIHEVD
jgi:hypothetical protein